jgi:hypothetical protein
MNALGKLLSVFVFLGALVWLGFTVVLFATRSDWKSTAVKAQQDADQAQKKADELHRDYNERLKAMDAGRVADQQAVATLSRSLGNLEKEYKTLKDATAALQSSTQKLQPVLDEYQAANKTVQIQADTYATQVTLLTTARDKAVLDQQAAERKANDAALALKVTQTALEDQIEKTRSMVEQSRGVAAEADAAFRGDVLQVGDSKGGNLDIITFTGGANSGVKPGKRYVVTRTTAPYYVGTVTVVNASDPRISSGVFTPAAGQKLAGDYIPKKGDTVSSN